MKSPLNFFKKIIEEKKKQNEQKIKNKLRFLFQELYQFYYDIQGFSEDNNLAYEIIFEKQKRETAKENAYNALLYHICDKSKVEKFTKKRLLQLKENHTNGKR